MSISIIKQTSVSNTTLLWGRAHTYIVVHYTAGSSSRAGTARNTALMFSNPNVCASADFIVDDEQIVQFNPDLDNRYTWHCGDNRSYTKGGSCYGRCANANSIGIEVCSTNPNWSASTPANSPNWSYTDAVISKTVELVQHLMQVYNIPVDRVIRHYDVSGKLCPGIIGWNADSGDESKWKAFKARLTNTSSPTVTTKTDNTSTKVNNKTIYRVQIGAFSNKSNADEQLKKIKAKGFNDSFVTKVDKLYKVQVGAFTVKSNAEKYRDKVKAAGFKDCFIVASGTAKKSVTEIAKEVIAGKWGVGSARKTALEKAGYDYNTVQSKVNELMK